MTKPDSGPVTSPGGLKSPESPSEKPPPPKPVEQPPAAPPDKLPDKPSAPHEATP